MRRAVCFLFLLSLILSLCLSYLPVKIAQVQSTAASLVIENSIDLYEISVKGAAPLTESRLSQASLSSPNQQRHTNPNFCTNYGRTAKPFW